MRMQDIFAAKNYRSIASLGEARRSRAVQDRRRDCAGGKKFTRKEGKPFAVVWVEDLTDMLEVVVWNEVYLKVSDALAAGRVVEIRGTLDKREELLRAIAQEIKIACAWKDQWGELKNRRDTCQELGRASAIFRAATGDELRQVREILASSPGRAAGSVAV